MTRPVANRAIALPPPHLATLCTLVLIAALPVLAFALAAQCTDPLQALASTRATCPATVNHQQPLVNADHAAYIVSFNAYRHLHVWTRTIHSTMSSVTACPPAAPLSCNISSHPASWSHLPRSPLALRHPTDFALISLAPRRSLRQLQIRALRQSHAVLFVTRQQRYVQRTLLRAEHLGARRRSDDNSSAAAFHHLSNRVQLPHAFGFHSMSTTTAAPSAASRRDPRARHGRRLLAAASGLTSRSLPSPEESIAGHMQAARLWERGVRGAGVRVAVFDTGLRGGHEHFAHVEERLNWTDEAGQLDDVLGHGSFVAGTIAGRHAACPGLAPDATLLVFRVFTKNQISYTAWFLDAFNYALHSQIDVLNLSIGGPDFNDQPFVRKVWEITSSGILLVSAMGNDGPRYGTLCNPADQMDVLGVTGLTRTLHYAPVAPTPRGNGRRDRRGGGHSRAQTAPEFRDHVASYSSRGMTTWELPAGYGRVKPDVGAYSKNLLGSHPNGGCRTLSGTSVASPVVAGAAALLIDSLRQRFDAARKADVCDAHAQSGGCGPASRLAALLLRNPMIVKQAVLATAVRLPLDAASAAPASASAASKMSRQTVPSSWLVAPNIFEQGAGKLDLLASYQFLQRARPHLSAHPAALNLTDCPHFFPVCAQPVFWSARPLLVNVTLLSSLAASSELDGAPELVDCNAAAGLLDVTFRWSEVLWPWSGFLSVSFTVARQRTAAIDASTATVSSPLIATGRIRVRVLVREAGRQLPQSPASVSELLIPFRVAVIAPPPRARRVLFDQFHSLRYPSGYFPRDNLDVKNDMLDWNGDHLHTNFRQLFVAMRQRGYFVDVLGRDYTCFDARLYGTLMIVDPEDEFAAVERAKLAHDVRAHGLSLLVFADWFNVDIMHTLRFFDENTRSHWTPVTGGANLPALNELLAPFGVAFGARVFRGELSLGVAKLKDKPSASPFRSYYASGSSLVRFPAGGTLVRASLTEVGSSGSSDRTSTVPIVGWTQTVRHDVQEEEAHSNQSSARLPLSSSSKHGGSGRIAVFGDSNCIDSSHQVAPCWDLALALLAYASDGVMEAGAFNGALVVDADWTDSNALWPQRPPNSAFARYSNVLSRNGTAQCPVPGSIGEPTSSSAETGAVGALQDPLLRRRGRLPKHAGRVAHGLSGAEVAADSHPARRQSVDDMLADERAWRVEWLAMASSVWFDLPGSSAEVANNGAFSRFGLVAFIAASVLVVGLLALFALLARRVWTRMRQSRRLRFQI